MGTEIPHLSTLLKKIKIPSFFNSGIILYEIFCRNGPYGNTLFSPEEILEKVRNPESESDLMRPDLDMLKDAETDYDCPDYVIGKLERFFIIF